MAINYRSHFAYRIDAWDADGENVLARNSLHLILSSNNDWVIPAGADARRFFVLDVASTHMRDFDYFAAIAAEMDNGGREALLDLLMQRDLSKFNVRSVPLTSALASQKAYSRRGIDRLVEILAHDGILPCADASDPSITITTGEDKGEGFYPAARKFAPDLKHLSSQIIAVSLRKDWGCNRWKSGYQRGIKFPTSPNCESASTSATASRNGRSSPTQLSGVAKMLAVFDLPTVPKAPKSLSRKRNLRATSFLWMPRRMPAEKPLWHGHSGDLGGLGRGQVGKIFWREKMELTEPRASRYREAYLSIRAFHHSTHIGSRLDLIDNLEVGENLPRRKLFDFLLVQTVEPIKERPLVRRQFRMFFGARHGDPTCFG
jgi:hypothetical protein